MVALVLMVPTFVTSIMVMIPTVLSMVTIVLIMVVLVVVPIVVIAPVTALVVMVVVRSIDFKPIQLMLLILQEKSRVTLFNGHLGEDVDDLDQAEGIKGRVVLLAEPEWASLPVAHLLPLAHLLLEEVLGHFG